MQITAPNLKKNFLKKIEEIVGPKGYSASNLDRFNYSRDSNFASTINLFYNRVDAFPDLIVWPESTSQVQSLIKLANNESMPIVPFGGGSGVCGGTLPVKGGMVVDVKRMRTLLKVDAENLLATAQAGMMSMHMEDELQRKGFTLSHYPSSIICASFGGCLAARSAGQTSSRYEKMEDMVRSVEFISGRGDIIRTRDMTNQNGIDLNQLFVGSEGTLGIFTEGTVRVYPYPKKREFQGFEFKNMQSAMEAMRRVMQAGLKPAVMRLYDELDTALVMKAKSSKDHNNQTQKIASLAKDFIKFNSVKFGLNAPKLLNKAFNLLNGCGLVTMHEGDPFIVNEEKKITREICLAVGAKELGDGPGKHWFQHRYSVSYNTSKLFHAGLFLDTIEVATTWDKIYHLYEEMRKTIAPHAMIMAHLSHAYTDGGALYFTFVAPLKGRKKSIELYNKIWTSALETLTRLGAVISHHHGIGRLKMKFMADEWGEGLELFKKFKDFYDPNGIMNPGKLVDLLPEEKSKVA